MSQARRRKRFKKRLQSLSVLAGVHVLHKLHRIIGRGRGRAPTVVEQGLVVDVIDVSVELEDLDIGDKELDDIEEQIRQVLETAGQDIVLKAAALCPVKTGALRASLNYLLDEEDLSLLVYSDMPYSALVEAKQPFLGPVVEAERELLQVEIDRIIMEGVHGNVDSDEADEDEDDMELVMESEEVLE